MEWGAWGAARGTKENGSWKKTLWLGGNWDSFISLPDLEISPTPALEIVLQFLLSRRQSAFFALPSEPGGAKYRGKVVSSLASSPGC